MEWELIFIKHFFCGPLKDLIYISLEVCCVLYIVTTLIKILVSSAKEKSRIGTCNQQTHYGGKHTFRLKPRRAKLEGQMTKSKPFTSIVREKNSEPSRRPPQETEGSKKSSRRPHENATTKGRTSELAKKRLPSRE